MTTCYICSDSKNCQTCHGDGFVSCSCQTGLCEECKGNGNYVEDGVRNTCSSCRGTGTCMKCQGSAHVKCILCNGSGYCEICRDVRLKWKQASDMAKTGDAYNAIVELHNLLKIFDEQKRSNMTTGRIGGAGAGALIGTIILPGVGTVVGGALGGLLGNRLGEHTTKSQVAFEAETNYRLGVIYEMMRHPAALSHYMQAKLLNPSHVQAAEALGRLQPSTQVSPQLAALDDDL